MGSKYTKKMRLQPSYSHKRNYDAFKAQKTCLVAASGVLFVLTIV